MLNEMLKIKSMGDKKSTKPKEDSTLRILDMLQENLPKEKKEDDEEEELDAPQ
jgi:hypothetical protein